MTTAMKGYLAFPPPSSTPAQLTKPEPTGTRACTAWTHSNGDARHPTHGDQAGDRQTATMEAERCQRREQERALCERSEIEWVRAGGVLRDAFGRRDKARTEQIRQELETQEVERARTARWETYEARWRALQSSTTPVAFAEFPWPLAERVSARDLGPLTRRAVSEFLFESLAIRSNTTTKKERIRVSFLRWHPDKISFVLTRVVPDDLELVREGVHVVFGILKLLQDAERTRDSLGK